MANPQVEDGHTRIADPVLEALMKAKLTGTQWDLVMAIIRMTWGWGKKEDYLSLTQFQKLTGRHRNQIARELTALQKRNIIQQTQKPTLKRAAKWKFNKDWEAWVSPSRVTGVSPSRVTPKSSSVTDEVPQPVGVTLEGDQSPPKLTYKRKKNKRRNKNAAPSVADPRFQPLKKFFHERYEEIRGTKLVTDGSDYAGLRKLLKQNPEFSLEDLQQAAVRYLRSDKPFYVDQGHPLRYWANNINPFLPGRKQWADDLKEVN